MAIPGSQDLDFGSGFQLISALMDNRASDPGSPKLGQFGIRAGLMRYYDGSQVATVGSGGAATPGVTDELPIQSVQRFKDGGPTPGATADTLDIPVIHFGESGFPVCVEVTGPGGTVRSKTVPVTVTPSVPEGTSEP